MIYAGLAIQFMEGYNQSLRLIRARSAHQRDRMLIGVEVHQGELNIAGQWLVIQLSD